MQRIQRIALVKSSDESDPGTLASVAQHMKIRPVNPLERRQQFAQVFGERHHLVRKRISEQFSRPIEPLGVGPVGACTLLAVGRKRQRALRSRPALRLHRAEVVLKRVPRGIQFKHHKRLCGNRHRIRNLWTTQDIERNRRIALWPNRNLFYPSGVFEFRKKQPRRTRMAHGTHAAFIKQQ